MTVLRKVLVVASWYPNRDHAVAGVFIRDQVYALQARTDVAVLYIREASDESAPFLTLESGIQVVRAQLRMPPKSQRLIGRIRAVATNLYNKFVRYPSAGLAAFEILRSEWGAPDIIHVQALWPAGLIARRIKRRYGIPFVVTEHSEEYLAKSERRLVRTPGIVRLVLRPLSRGASRTIAVSHFLGDRLVELGLASNPVIIPNVVEPRPPVLRGSGLPHLILHVSVMSPAKNLGSLLMAVDRLRQTRDDFRLLLVGDGESRGSVEKLAADYRFDDVVEFTGHKSADEVREMFAQSAFTVISSTHETFSVVAAESLMCGRPVLSTRCGGPEEFITPEVGRLIAVDSVDALVDGLDWMLDHYSDFDPQALHEYARERFAPDVVAEQILAVYGSVLSD